MAYQPIENYGMIGNMRTVALAGLNGSIDWYCYPHFDSPSIFGALLDDTKGGRFRISSLAERFKSKQLYWPSTNILITRFLSVDGIADIEDFMPVGVAPDSTWSHHLYRRIRCVRGSMRLSVACRPAFDYGRKPHTTRIEANGALFITDDLVFALSTTVPLRQEDKDGVAAEFTLKEGESRVFLFKEVDVVGCPGPPNEAEAEELFQSSVKFWQRWISSCTYFGRWREQVHRSALALKLLTFEPTGAIIAAPTTSLPEVVGGSRNWDYRYTWLRDAAFTVYGFLRIGFTSEAAAFVQWMQNCAATCVRSGQPMPVLTIRGETLIPEQILGHWEGYRGSGPVRIGNAAVAQHQNDIYGELMDAMYLHNKYVTPISYDFWRMLSDRLDWVCDNWELPDEGIWEMRTRSEHFVYSKVMNWVALDRGLRLAEKRSFPANREKWIKERDRIYEQIMTQGWNQERQAFTQFYGSSELDASVLIMPLVFFLAPTDPRMLRTMDAILDFPRNGGLASDSMVYRYPARSDIDGLPGQEGAFNMCSFWMVEALTRAGQAIPERRDQARLFFERILGYANHLGLYAEQTGSEGESLGNFPQAFTHFALISAAYNLDRVLGSGRHT